MSQINWKSKYNNSKYLQEFYDEFISTIKILIKQFVSLTKLQRKSKIYLFNIKKSIEKKLKLYKQCKTDKQMKKKYKKDSNKYQKAVKIFNKENEKSFFQNISAKKKLLLCKIKA